MRRFFPTGGTTFPRLLSVLLLAAAPPASAGQPTREATGSPTYSIILVGGTVVDGTGREGTVADVAISGGRIAAIGDLSNAAAAFRVDVTGLVVSPGFIDIHSHADGDDAVTSPIGRRPMAENYLRQGVTSVFGGQDGSSTLDVGAFLAALDALPAAVNLGLFVGHGSVRAAVMGEDDRDPTREEMDGMRRLVERAMRDGAFGLSSGLEYTPGAFARTDELMALAAATAPWNGLYISHVREEGGALLESVDEVIAVARGAGVAAQLTHHKIIGKHRWGGTRGSLERAARARAEGLDVSLDVYPYTASSTNLTILFPNWSKDGGFEALRTRLADPATRARIRADVVAHIDAERGGDPSTIVASRCGFDASLSGLSLADMARAAGLEPTVGNAADIALDLVERGSCQGVFHSMSEEDVQRVLQDEASMVASDGGIPAFGQDAPHPRSYGTFARVLARYVRDLGVLTLADAVRRMSGAPAARLGLEDRGVLRVGAIADVTVFDPASVQDHATFADPHRYATGVVHVFVGGTWALRDGEPTGLRAGRALRKAR